MIGKKMQERLWQHLLLLEEETGSPLRGTPRFEPTDCPLENFAPDKDQDGDKFSFACNSGTVRYWRGYRIYTFEDSAWWKKLEETTKIAITRWVGRKIKAYYKSKED